MFNFAAGACYSTEYVEASGGSVGAGRLMLHLVYDCF